MDVISTFRDEFLRFLQRDGWDAAPVGATEICILWKGTPCILQAAVLLGAEARGETTATEVARQINENRSAMTCNKNW